jgi:hypothetical protein
VRDSDRPPVLAHVRFAADRAAFQGLGLRARFERIHASNLWGASTSVSGLGSEQATTSAWSVVLAALLRDLNVRSLLDAPCGDAQWIQRLGLPLDYTGVDIVPALVQPLQQRAAAGDLSGRTCWPTSRPTRCRAPTPCCAAIAWCTCRSPTSRARSTTCDAAAHGG